jgi:hypothetical protein
VGALLSLAASVAVFTATPAAVATTGDPSLIGRIDNIANNTTDLSVQRGTCACDGAGGLKVVHAASATDVNTVGIVGQGTATGIEGTGIYGVHGHSDTGWGVWGEGSDRGVYGVSANEGVVGFSNNVGIRAESPNIALRVKGKAEFSRSGTVTISYPNKQATVTGVPVTAKSLAFATLQQFLSGRYVLAAVPNLGGSSNSFTIYLNKAPGSSSTPKSVVVGWHVIEKP